MSEGNHTNNNCICERCGTAFYTAPYRILIGRGRFCSRACKYPSQVSRVCVHCGTDFSVQPHRVAAGRGQFCSTECYWLDKAAATRPCKHCGTTVEYCQSNEQIFCSRRCHSEFQFRPEAIEARFLSSILVAGPDECHIWTGTVNEKGYGRFCIGASQDGPGVPAHRFAYELANGPIICGEKYTPEYLECCHTCDNPPCCNVGHLFLGTRQENSDDMMKKGRNGKTKLADEIIIQMRQQHSSGTLTIAVLADIHGISFTHAWRIVTGRSRPLTNPK